MLKIGTVIDGKYKILNVVGKGGMSTVYLAMNEKVNKQWAIKEILKQEKIDYELVKKEIEMMKRLKHPNLPAIADVIENPDTLLIVMDYIEGQTLEKILLDRGNPEETEVIEWAKQLCGVLDYLHNQTPPIIYRDMKPSNVILKPDGTVMLIDFGAAREYDPERAKDTVLLGTRGYAAPEQYKKDAQSDARTDIYSLGVTMFRLLTGLLPQELKALGEDGTQMSPGLTYIVTKCTQLEMHKRYETAKELLFALEHYWEYDENYRKKQQKKMKLFLCPVFLAFICMIGALRFGTSARYIRNNNYENYLQKAQNAHEFSEAVENCQRAICLKPENETAYIQLLSDILLEDGVLKEHESHILRQTMIMTDENGVTNEESLKKNSEGYAEFCYEAGLAYFYKYSEKPNKKYAEVYFETAAKSEELQESRRNRAQRLYLISDYYSRIGVIDEAGDIKVSYKDYWEDLTAASSGNIVEDDNERTALVMYEEIISQVISNAAELTAAGVSKEELMVQIKEIEFHLKNDFQGMNTKKEALYIEEIESLLEKLRIAADLTESL